MLVQPSPPLPPGIDLITLLDAVQDSVYVIDPHTSHIAWCNRTGAQSLGLSVAEVVGRSVLALRVDAPPASAWQAMAQQVRDAPPCIWVGCHRHRNGQALRVEVSIRLLETPARLWFVAVARNANDGMAERYQEVVENLGEGMGIVQNGVTVYVNLRAAELLERDPGAMLGVSLLDWVHPDDHAMVLERQRMRERGEPVPERYELRCITGTGRVRWMGTRTSALLWEGQPATMTFFADVTEQRGTLQALQASEKRYRSVVQQLGEGMMVIQQGRVIFANRQSAVLLGRAPEALENMPALEVVHPDDRALVAERLRARDTGQQLDVETEFRIIWPDGSQHWLNTHSSTADWEGQSATLTFFTDNTRQRRMIEALHQSEERYRQVVEHVGEGMVVVQGERFAFVNTRASAIVEMPIDDMMARGYLERIHPDDHALVQQRRLKRLAGEAVPNRYEIRLQMPDGRVKWIDIGVTLVPWEGGTATLTFFSDESERKKLENQLTNTLAEREIVLNTSVVGIAFLTPEGRFRWANPAMLGLFGGQALGSFYSMEQVYLTRQQYLEVGAAVAKAIGKGELFQRELPMRKLDGTTIWVSLSGQAVNHDNLLDGTVWTALDITERMHAEEGIRTALAQQRQLNDLRTRFVSMTSHEFRTPLATILSSTELLKFYGERMEVQERQDLLQSIEAGVQRMTTMLDRVLMLGRVEAQMMTFTPQSGELGPLCQAIVDETLQAVPAKLCAVELRSTPHLPVGQFDPTLLRHIFGNLLNNAIKYSPAGGQVVFDLGRDESHFVVSVSDQGIGIPADEVPHLFASFHRASNVGDIKGTGLGLAIVKQAVELHGGGISVHSQTGQGTCFTVRLPL